jgi:N-acetylneuraminic acid mutarotase
MHTHSPDKLSVSKGPTTNSFEWSVGFVLTVTLATFAGLSLAPNIGKAQGETWSTKTDMPTARTHAECAAVDGTIYVMGGSVSDGPCIATVEAYDTATDTWEQKADMPAPSCAFAVGGVDGIIYAAGGQPHDDRRAEAPLSSVNAYDPASDTWTTKQPLARTRTEGTASMVDGMMYVIGGWNWDDIATQGDGSPAPYKRKPMEAYDPATDTWVDKEGMPFARRSLASAALDGKVYVVGGQGGNDALGPPDLFAVFDPAADAWGSGNALGTGNLWTGLGAGVLGGKIYALGGATGFTETQLVMMYDPGTDTWEARSDIPLPQGRSNPCVSVVEDKLYVIGGSRFGPPNTRYYPTVFELDLGLVTATERDPGVPAAFALHGNYPNPFNPATTLPVDVSSTEHVHLTVHDVLGNRLRVLKEGLLTSGRHEIVFEAGDLPSGLYVARLATPEGVFTRNMLLTK